MDVRSPGGRLRAVNVRLLAIRFLKQRPGWADPSAVNKGFGYRVRARIASQRGFTLIEVLVSALITTLIATAVAGALITNTDIISNQTNRSEAETLAEQDQERLKGLSAEQLDNLSQTYNVTAGGTVVHDRLAGLVPEHQQRPELHNVRRGFRNVLQDDLDGHEHELRGA